MNTNIVAGIDEAGRGCVLGPMVLSICAINEKDISYFKKIGVKDSKLLSIPKRELLFKIIQDRAIYYKIIVVPAQEINVLMNEFSLNEIETMKFADLINSIKKSNKDLNLNEYLSKIVIDCPEKNTERFKLKLNKFINIDFQKKIVAENKADLNYICVGCASILAKVTRDKLLKNLVKCSISGYPADVNTINYIKQYILKNKQLPDFTRTKWKTVDKIFKDLYQKKLGWFDERK